MSEFKIARFVGIEACRSIFSENSTFVLRSPKHYWRLYETSEGEDTKGDGNNRDAPYYYAKQPQTYPIRLPYILMGSQFSTLNDGVYPRYQLACIPVGGL